MSKSEVKGRTFRVKREYNLRSKFRDACGNSLLAPYPGLSNLGNTCYLNCALQVLFYCPGFLSHLYSLEGKISSKVNIISELAALYRLMESNLHLKKEGRITKPINPHKLVQSVGRINKRFSDVNLQQDAQEFLRFLLGYIQDMEREPCAVENVQAQEVQKPRQKRKACVLRENCKASDSPQREAKRQKTFHNEGTHIENNHQGFEKENINPQASPKKPESYVERLFQGHILSKIKCLGCNNESCRNEPFMDLSLTIEKNKALKWSLNQYVAEERLCGQNKYHCSQCHNMSEAVREVQFSDLPPILMIHLKRFTYDRYRKKISHQIPCPSKIKLEQFTATNKEGISVDYELFALIFHQGTYSTCGHYVTLIKLDTQKDKVEEQINEIEQINSPTNHQIDIDNQVSWLYLDDGVVTYKQQEQVLTLLSQNSNTHNTAYILFYKRTDFNPSRDENAQVGTKH